MANSLIIRQLCSKILGALYHSFLLLNYPITMKNCLLLSLFGVLLWSCSLWAQEQKLPEMNQKIIAYVTTKIDKKVGRGECWDLAKYALEENEAQWDHRLRFGKAIDPQKEAILPGDIVQFENVKVEYNKGQVIHTETMTQHTAIVYEVKAKGEYVLAHQNTEFSGRKVGLSDLRLADVKRGKLRFYRPQP